MIMGKYWRIVWEMIEGSDVVLEVVDARFPSICRSNRLEKSVMEMEKKSLLIALNKSDLVPRKHTDSWIKWLRENEGITAVPVSATKRLGTSIIRETILRSSRRKKAIVAVVGLPNTGKSSLINSLSGRKAASVAPISGHTKGKQTIKISRSITMYDTPGVIPVKLPRKHKTLLGLIPITKIKDPIWAALSLYDELTNLAPGVLQEHYDIQSSQSDFLEKLAIKHNKVMKGGVPDEKFAAIILLKDHIRGKIPIYENVKSPLRYFDTK